MSEMDAQLEIKERLPYTGVLTHSFLKLNNLIGKENPNWNTIQIMIQSFNAEIPKTWRDQKFIDEMKGAIKTKIIDARPSFAGVRMDKETCNELGLPLTKEKPEVDYFMVKNAIVNLLDRLNLLIRKEKIEYSTGVNLSQTLDDLGEKFEDEQQAAIDKENGVEHDPWQYAEVKETDAMLDQLEETPDSDAWNYE